VLAIVLIKAQRYFGDVTYMCLRVCSLGTSNMFSQTLIIWTPITTDDTRGHAPELVKLDSESWTCVDTYTRISFKQQAWSNDVAASRLGHAP
jgi:hypothetical protein